MGGVSAAISKTAAAPIERVKLLLQNQGELVKSGRLAIPYKVTSCQQIYQNYHQTVYISLSGYR